MQGQPGVGKKAKPQKNAGPRRGLAANDERDLHDEAACGSARLVPRRYYRRLPDSSLACAAALHPGPPPE